MANKCICDRCGTEMEKKSVWFEELPRLELKIRKNPIETEPVDLCEECSRELDDWFKNEKKCKCNKNENVLELLEQLENAEKQICEQSQRIEQLLDENRQLANGAVQKLLESLEISIYIKKKND